MKVLHVVGTSKFGGAFTVIFSLCRMACEHGIEPHVLTTDEEAERECRARGIGVVPFPGIPREIRPIADWRDARRLAAFLKCSQFDIVHTHTTKGGVVGRRAATLAGTPVIIHHAHAFPFHPFNPTPVNRFYAWVERRAAAWCDRIITTTTAERLEAIARGVCAPEKIAVVHNGIPDGSVPASFDRVAARTELGYERNDVVCIVVGRVEHLKGHGVLVDAVARINRQNPSSRIRVLVVGSGEDLERYRRRVEALGLHDRIAFAGFRSDVTSVLRAADLFCLPSYREGVSIALLEAMAAGLPCVVSDIRGMREVVPDETVGVLVPAGDPERLATALERLACAPDARVVMGMRARAIFQERFSEDRLIRDAWTVYQTALAARGLL